MWLLCDWQGIQKIRNPKHEMDFMARKLGSWNAGRLFGGLLAS
jgi:hypothetical protein